MLQKKIMLVRWLKKEIIKNINVKNIKEYVKSNIKYVKNEDWSNKEKLLNLKDFIKLENTKIIYFL